MNYFVTIGVLFFSNFVYCQQASVPYVFYAGDSIFIRSADTVIRLDKKPSGIDVKFSDKPDWNFTVPLQHALENEPSEFRGADKLFILSDIEGEFEAFRALLLAGDVIDKKYNWKYGKGHLVICGDLFDRGERVTEYLWLLYKLELDAKSKGGYVHVILGNHDIMNLSGDFRYVQQKYFDEATRMGVAYKDLFGPGTELGKWLRTKNTIEKIGDRLFVHAGVSSQINAAQLSLDKINSICRPFYDTPMKDIPDSMKLFFKENSLFWYRGYFVEPTASYRQVDSTLRLYKVRTIIAGHTILESITSYYQGKVVGIDVNEHEGNHQALLIKINKFYIIDDKGNQRPLQGDLIN